MRKQPPYAKAVWFTGPNSVEIRESRDTPVLHEREVRVRTLFSGISSGTEMLVYQGSVPKNLPLGIGSASKDSNNPSFQYPVKYGYSNVGMVVEADARCHTLKVGDLVFTFHPHETEFIADEYSCTVLPREVDPKLGVFVSNIETAIGLVHDSEIRLGEAVVVFGLGVVGLITISLLKRAGARRIIAIDPLSSRRRVARAMGADESIDPTDPGLNEIVKKLGTEDSLPDLLVEVSGSPSALQGALDLSGRESRIIIGSWYGEKQVMLNLGRTFHRNRNRIISSQVSNLNPALSGRWSKERRLGLAVEQLHELPLIELLTDIFPFQNAPDAYKKIAERPESTLQVILDYSGEER